MVNAHVDMDTENALDPFIKVFKDAVLHVLTIPNYAQTLIVIVKPFSNDGGGGVAEELDMAESLWDYRATTAVLSHRDVSIRVGATEDVLRRPSLPYSLRGGQDDTVRGGWLDGGCFSSSTWMKVKSHPTARVRRWYCTVATLAPRSAPAGNEKQPEIE